MEIKQLILEQWQCQKKIKKDVKILLDSSENDFLHCFSALDWIPFSNSLLTM